ncbi:MAG: superoxide dismutase family protein [Novosphingobium sp.]
MRYVPFIAAASGLILLTGCATSPQEPATFKTLATASLITSSGNETGTAELREQAGKVHLHVRVSNMSSGMHGIHIHAVGSCEAPAFTSAGPHLNPHARQHGSDNPAGSHLGDLPNLVTSADGSGTLDYTLPSGPAEVVPLVMDADGAAIVIHAGADDYRTDPSGNSGTRIACGVLSRPV